MIEIRSTLAAALGLAMAALMCASAVAEGSRSTGPPAPWGYYPNERGRPPPSGLADPGWPAPSTSPDGRAGRRTQSPSAQR